MLHPNPYACCYPGGRNLLGRSTGLEPATPGTTNQCSDQLSYDRRGRWKALYWHAHASVPRRRQGQASSGAPKARVLEPDEHLARVGASEEADERQRCGCEAVHDRLLKPDPALSDPARHVSQELGLQMLELGDDEPLHLQ